MNAKPMNFLVIAVSLVYVSLSVQCAGKQVQGIDPSPVKVNDTLRNKDTFHLQSEKLKLVIANNEAYGPVHAAGYSGISEIYFRSENEKNLFTPRAGGLNFEFIFSGDSSSYEWNIFEPRRSRMEIERLSSSKIRLRQSRTSNWPLKSEITYSLVGDAIDFEYTGVPLNDLWKKHGYIGVFFATYIDGPELRGINFIGKLRDTTEDNSPRWIYNLPAEHGVDANHRPVGSQWDPGFDPGFPITLISGFSNYEYVYHFYYGQSGENVFILMFGETEKDGELRFAQSPNSGSKGSINPAWDFLYLRRNYQIGKKFTFSARAVYKKFAGKQDVIEVYEKWSGKKVAAP